MFGRKKAPTDAERKADLDKWLRTRTALHHVMEEDTRDAVDAHIQAIVNLGQARKNLTYKKAPVWMRHTFAKDDNKPRFLIPASSGDNLWS